MLVKSAAATLVILAALRQVRSMGDKECLANTTDACENGLEPKRLQTRKVIVSASGNAEVNQVYDERDPTVIPSGFDHTCKQMGWDTKKMWVQLSDQRTPWYEAPNGSYIYWNQGDGKWWIDAPDGGGVFIVKAPSTGVPASGWSALKQSSNPVPAVSVV
jgi:hypothetical protein